VLAVNTWDEPRNTLRQFASVEGLKQRILVGGSAVGSTYGVSSVPATVFIDRRGEVVDAELGFHGPADLERRVSALLARLD
jgi:hypothetical protein